MEKTAILTPEELLKNWQGHRNLTRKVIELFPEKELFEFSIGGMRPFSEMVKEFLAIAVPGLKEFVSDTTKPFEEDHQLKTKAQLLQAWDEATVAISDLWSHIPHEKFREMNNLFGQYNFPVIDNIQYFIDNEIHHRGQGYVYLRALGIEPPFFWERN
ncbi:DinB family protein [Pseudopedobacter saltans DSM 12145]|uniref:DinB family protein n=1 Tax=Pseudopedobacter saltans (strain ATCC 51119 / DSM 12145 / JCM 21818 / CCUG 39354 / LMG 10337 / NBRC 100064 / NCIMB 13643) TaxID=762903 RepID=F0S9Y3_PSESL|nr:DinB family protein [Pseudopedobacter saltans]ADY52541.1 DinB family protein [Pseudopedobacter saltans DSM 12145]